MRKKAVNSQHFPDISQNLTSPWTPSSLVPSTLYKFADLRIISFKNLYGCHKHFKLYGVGRLGGLYVLGSVSSETIHQRYIWGVIFERSFLISSVREGDHRWGSECSRNTALMHLIRRRRAQSHASSTEYKLTLRIEALLHLNFHGARGGLALRYSIFKTETLKWTRKLSRRHKKYTRSIHWKSMPVNSRWVWLYAAL